MTARASVQQDISRQTVNVTAVRDGSVLRIASEGMFSFEQVDPRTQPEVSLVLPEDIAHAIYVAFAEYYGHSSNDIRALRRDYEAERSRVDKFIDHMISS